MLPTTTYETPQSRVDFFSRLTERLEQIPGVQSSAAMTGLPPIRRVNANDTDFEGYQAPPDGPFENVDYYQRVTLDYLDTMGIPVVEGRGFTLADVTGAPAVLVNETLVKTFFHGAEPHRTPPPHRLQRPGAAGSTSWGSSATSSRVVSVRRPAPRSTFSTSRPPRPGRPRRAT